MSIYLIGMQFRHPSSWQRTFVDFAETSLHPPPHARSSTPRLPCQGGNAALRTSVKYCQMMGKKWKSWERRKRKHFMLPGKVWLMTSAPAGWRWRQRALTDNGMPAVEFAHFMLFLVTWFWGRPNFFDIWPCKFESWYIILHLRPPRVAAENVLQAPGTELIKARNERKLNMNARGASKWRAGLYSSAVDLLEMSERENLEAKAEEGNTRISVGYFKKIFQINTEKRSEKRPFYFIWALWSSLS